MPADLLQFLQIRAIHHELNRRVLCATTADVCDLLNRRPQVRGQRLDDVVAHDLHDRELVALPSLDWPQANIDTRQVSRLCRIARDRDHCEIDFREALSNCVGDPVGNDFGGFQARAFGRADVDFELGLVVLRNEVLVGDGEERDAREQDDHRDGGDDEPVGHRPFEESSVEDVDGVEDFRIFDECWSLPWRLTLSQRAASIGVSVKLTTSETMIANAIVRPKLFMKRPTMPPMKPTGTKIATSDSVVARTARPISFVASMAASIWFSCFSSMNR